MVSTRRSVLSGSVSLLGLLLANRNNEVSAQQNPDTVYKHCWVCNLTKRPIQCECVDASGKNDFEALENLLAKIGKYYDGYSAGPPADGQCQSSLVRKTQCCPCGRWTAIATCKKEGQISVYAMCSARTRIAAKRLALEQLQANLKSWGYDPDCCGGCVQVIFDRNSP